MNTTTISRLIVLTETDPEIALGLMEILQVKASRENLTVTIALIDNVEDAVRRIRGQKRPLLISINPCLKRKKSGVIESHAGLDLLETAGDLKIPTIVRSEKNSKEIRKHLRSRKIMYQPDVVVSPNLHLRWSEAIFRSLALH